VLDLIALSDDLCGIRSAVDRPSDGFLHCARVIVLNLFVVRGVPVNEHPTDENVISFILKDDALRNAIGNGFTTRGSERASG
jgi:hypothetical protein